MRKDFTFSQMIGSLRKAIQRFPDKRIGKNLTYSIEDVGLGAFSVFLLPSDHLSWLIRRLCEQIPSDNHI